VVLQVLLQVQVLLQPRNQGAAEWLDAWAGGARSG
jgi:hypothetical protein